jgi:hypothetical protein
MRKVSIKQAFLATAVLAFGALGSAGCGVSSDSADVSAWSALCAM